MWSMLRVSLARMPTLIPKTPIFEQSAAMFHALMKPSIISTSAETNKLVESNILTPFTPSVVPNCGFKVKGRLKRRCKDCYFVVRQQRLYVICKTHPRHKQMSMVPSEKNTWILTHATQGKVRQW